MSEGAKDREGQPKISISEQSFLSACRGVNTEEDRNLLRVSNPHVLADVEDLVDYYTEEKREQMLRGVFIFHRSLREEAEKFHGVILPMFTEQFIEDYAENKQNEKLKIREEGMQGKYMSNEEAGRESRESHRRDIFAFRALAPEFSRIVEKELGVQPNWRPEEDHRYTGIIYQYLLISEGLKDPKNFVQ